MAKVTETEVTGRTKAGWGSKSRQRGTGGCCWVRRHEGENRDSSEHPRDTPKSEDISEGYSRLTWRAHRPCMTGRQLVSTRWLLSDQERPGSQKNFKE